MDQQDKVEDEVVNSIDLVEVNLDKMLTVVEPALDQVFK